MKGYQPNSIGPQKDTPEYSVHLIFMLVAPKFGLACNRVVFLLEKLPANLLPNGDFLIRSLHVLAVTLYSSFVHSSFVTLQSDLTSSKCLLTFSVSCFLQSTSTSMETVSIFLSLLQSVPSEGLLTFSSSFLHIFVAS